MAIQNALHDLSELSRYHAAVRGERVAITFEGWETTFGQLDRRASRVANGLRATCTTAQARVAVLDKNSDSFFELLFGAAKARDVLVPVNWRLAPAEIAYVINEAQAEILFVGEEYVAVVEELRPERQTVKRIVALSGGHPDWEEYVSWRDAQASADPRLETPGDDVVLQMYTSGTTGHPKGAQMTQDGLMVSLPMATRTWYSCTAADVSLVSMPQYHFSGGVIGLVSLYAGTRTVTTRGFDPAEVLRLIPAERVTHTGLVPAALLFVLQTPGCRETDFSSLRYMVYGGSPIPIDLLCDAVEIFQCGFGQVYGMTEIGMVTTPPSEDHDPGGSRRMRSAGKPLANAEIKVVGEDGAALPPHQVGEIVARTPQLMKGYWRLPDATAMTVRDGWVYTGDAGYFDEDGYLPRVLQKRQYVPMPKTATAVLAGPAPRIDRWPRGTGPPLPGPRLASPGRCRCSPSRPPVTYPPASPRSSAGRRPVAAPS